MSNFSPKFLEYCSLGEEGRSNLPQTEQAEYRAMCRAYHPNSFPETKMNEAFLKTFDESCKKQEKEVENLITKLNAATSAMEKQWDKTQSKPAIKPVIVPATPKPTPKPPAPPAKPLPVVKPRPVYM